MEHHTLGCVIFDLDGTLLDSMNVWSQIDRNLLNHYGKTAPDDLTEQVKKMTIQQSAQYFIDRFQLPCEPEEFIALVQSMAADAYRNTLQLKSGVFPLLDWLDARNVPYCEDAVHAIETAATDGFFTVGVYEPTLSEMDWNTIQARATVSVKDLQKLLAEIQSGRIPL